MVKSPWFRCSKICLLIALFQLAACAVGNRYHYREVVAALPSITGVSVAVATHDSRPYILSQNKKPSFVGLQRGGYGNPFDVLNKNNEPLSTSFTHVVCESIKSSGGSCIEVGTTPAETRRDLTTKLAETGAPRAILMTLMEWKSDTYQNVGLRYDVDLEVITPPETVLIRKKMRGFDDLRGSFWNPPAYAKKAVPKAFQRKIQELYTDSEVLSALQQSPLPNQSSKEPPSTTPTGGNSTR